MLILNYGFSICDLVQVGKHFSSVYVYFQFLYFPFLKLCMCTIFNIYWPTIVTSGSCLVCCMLLWDEPPTIEYTQFKKKLWASKNQSRVENL
jgi:hypothetical protein